MDHKSFDGTIVACCIDCLMDIAKRSSDIHSISSDLDSDTKTQTDRLVKKLSAGEVSKSDISATDVNVLWHGKT